MKINLKICDLCRGDDRVVRLAKIAYTGDKNKVFHACSSHAKDIKKYKLPIIETFIFPGDADEDCLDAEQTN